MKNLDRLIKNTLLILVSSFALSLVLHVNTVFAASTVMDVIPQTGSYGAPFSVSLLIDGHRDLFNAAQATVSPSGNLKVDNLVLGDCNFSFLKTPSVADPSFEGAILGGSLKKCTVYTLMLSPIAKGLGTVSLSQASVKRYGDAAEVLSSHQDGKYTITGTTSTGTKTVQEQETPIPTPANGLYNVIIKVLSGSNQPVSAVSVSLTSVANKTPLTTITNTTGKALFQNIHSGVYAVSVDKDNNELAKTILNVTGLNHVLILGINLQAQQSNPLLKNSGSVLGATTFSPYLIAGILALGVLVGITIAVLPRLLKRRKKA